MQARVLWFPVVIAGVLTAGLWASPHLVRAQNAPADTGQHSQEVGAPQVLEIPVQSNSPQPSFGVENPPPAQVADFGDVDPNGDWSSPTTDGQFLNGPTRLGLSPNAPTSVSSMQQPREGPEGVQVLSVIEDSPAHRSGFEGVNTPTQHNRNDLVKKMAIIALAMSPAGPVCLAPRCRSRSPHPGAPSCRRPYCRGREHSGSDRPGLYRNHAALPSWRPGVLFRPPQESAPPNYGDARRRTVGAVNPH